jgi:hypothetical protein
VELTTAEEFIIEKEFTTEGMSDGTGQGYGGIQHEMTFC